MSPSLLSAIRRRGAAVGPERLLTLAIGVAVAVVTCRFLRLSAATLQFSYPLDYGENLVLDVAIRLSYFWDIYPAMFDSPPWFVTNYPPVYFMVRAPFIWYDHPALWAGRLISQLSALGTALFIGLTLRRLTGDRAASVLASVLFAALPFVAVSSQLDRAELLGLFLSWVALWSLTAAPDHSLAVACLVASTYTQPAAALPALAAGYVWLWDQRRRAQANQLLVYVVAITGGIAFLLNRATGGGFLLHVGTIISDSSTWSVTSLATQPLTSMSLLLLAAVVSSLAAWRYRLTGWSLIFSYVAAAALLIPIHSKCDSSIVLLHVSAASALATAACTHWLRPSRVAMGAFALGLTLQIGWLGLMPSPYAPIQARLRHWSDYDALAATVRQIEGPALADEGIGLLWLSGRSVDFHPFAMSRLAAAGRWNPAGFSDRLDRRHYSVIVLRRSFAEPSPSAAFWTPQLAAALVRNYDRAAAFELGNGLALELYRPKGTRLSIVDSGGAKSRQSSRLTHGNAILPSPRHGSFSNNTPN